jgi:hypothetical protein
VLFEIICEFITSLVLLIRELSSAVKNSNSLSCLGEIMFMTKLAKDVHKKILKIGTMVLLATTISAFAGLEPSDFKTVYQQSPCALGYVNKLEYVKYYDTVKKTYTGWVLYSQGCVKR